jgi:ribosome biogenesis GTPase / thiamine phosphate phosphatase
MAKSVDDLEEQHLPRDSKEWRKERRRARATDRSQEKKSDRNQRAKRPTVAETEIGQLPMGRVLSVTAQSYEVDTDGETLLCVLRRTHLQARRRAKGLVTVGDLVFFSRTLPGEGVIEGIAERYSLLTRSDSLQARRQHFLAANIDQVLATASLGSPPLKPALIDRYIIAALKGNMQPVVVINKVDLGQPGELAPLVALYETLGYSVVAVSVRTGQGLDHLRQVMRNKASVFAGQSGVGKSSLINAVTGLSLPVGELVAKTRKGTHTTTRSRLIRLPAGGWCIDTPGIRSFGLWELSREEVARFFPELEKLRPHCQFPNCSHSHEPNCAVIEALEQGEISPLRYESYLTLLEESTADRHRRR